MVGYNKSWVEEIKAIEEKVAETRHIIEDLIVSFTNSLMTGTNDSMYRDS